MPFLEVNGARLCFEKQGSGPNAVVFIHGGNGGLLSTLTAGYGNDVDHGQLDMPRTTAGASSMYGSLIAAIQSSSRTIISYDRRCAGASEYTIDRYFGIETMALDCIELVRKLGFSGATVVGSSMGGPVALWIAIHQPSFCQRLVILNSHPQIAGAHPPYMMDEKRAARIQELLAMGPEEQRREFDKRNHAERMRRQAPIDVDRDGGGGHSRP